jgi:N utilization substance protein A
MAVVPDDKLSLAIGKDGQNARLAVRLTGWKIDVKSESNAAKLNLTQNSDEQNDAEVAEEEAQTENLVNGEDQDNA